VYEGWKKKGLAQSSSEAEIKQVEGLRTTTLFLMAQVYQHREGPVDARAFADNPRSERLIALRHAPILKLARSHIGRVMLTRSHTHIWSASH
jgi:hypothetical protein